jgi:pimeloyl-ACP methyl ester carboxylesterase
VPRASLRSGIEIEYEVLGHGRPLLLIGGLGAQMISWDDEFCELLVERGYSVIRFDNRDSGLSSGFDDSGVPDLLGMLLDGAAAPYLLDDMADDAIGLLDHVHVARCDLVGLSLGGMIAQLVAMREPRRVRSLVVALSGPPGRPADMPQPAVVEALLRAPGRTFEERVSNAVALRRALAGDGGAFDAAGVRRRAEAQIMRAHRPAGTMRQAAAVIASPNRLRDLDRITVPAMFVHGENDPLVPYASARAAAEAVRNAAIVPIAGLGHDMPEHVARRLIDRIVEFHSAQPE